MPSGMSELRVKRWRRYGHDRLYVNDADGTRVGWVDLRTGETVIEAEEQREAVEAAVHEYRAADDESGQATEQPHPDSGTEETTSPTTSANPPSGPTPPSDPEPYVIQVDWHDLGHRQAGQAVREQAVAARQTAPIKTLAARVLGVHTDERAWRIGAKGEEKVAARLDRLPDGWHVLHAIPVGDRGADIDHLAIGPAGVFTINAKHHPDARVWVGGNTFMVNGHRQPYVRNARHEAARASKLLSAATGHDVAATGVIAVVGAHKGIDVKTQPDDVHVTARKHLTRWLTRLPTSLTDAEVGRIHAAARRSDTWQ